MMTRNFGIRLIWAAVASSALITSCSGDNLSKLGPACADYLGENGCCLKAAGANAVAIDACKEAIAQYASLDGSALAEASCKAAQGAAVAAGLCSSDSGGDGGGGDGGMSDPSAACTNYLACIAKVAPEAFPAALLSYGPDSPCWSSPSTAPVCATACKGALDVQREVSGSVPECRRCASDADCWSALPACDPATKTCVTCVTDAHCKTSAGGHVCQPDTHECVACVKDSDCANGACSDHQCVECNTDNQCPSHLCSAHRCIDGCFINGAFKPPFAANPANFCQTCLPSKTRSMWSALPDGWFCGVGNVCSGTTCKAGCFIDGTYYAPNTLRPTNPCESCQPLIKTSSWTALGNGVSCGTGASCSSGACIPKFSTQTSGTIIDLYTVWGSAKDDVFVVGAIGTILHTKNSGATWTQQMSGTGSSLFSVWGSAKDDVFAVGVTGTILHTTDSGVTWIKQIPGTTAHLYDVWSSSKNDVFIVGAAGTILHTNDGGATWIKQNSGTTAPLSGVWGTSSNDVYVVGGGGTILHTKDGGATWNKQNSSTTGDFFEIFGLSDGIKSLVYTVGPAGIFSTGNGGLSWSGVSLGTLAVPVNVWTSGSLSSATSDLYVVRTDGGIAHSSDWGLHWNTAPINAPTLSGVWGSDSSDVYIVGYGGTILHHP